MMLSGRIGEERNYTGYCDKTVDALIDRQSSEPDPEKRRQLMWEIERRLARDASRPIIFYTRAATRWRLIFTDKTNSPVRESRDNWMDKGDRSA
jgi:peptide/nickel transport system substrate-binding protein